MRMQKRWTLFVCLAVAIGIGILAFGPGAFTQGVIKQPRPDNKRKPQIIAPVVANYDIRIKQPVKEETTENTSANQLTLETLKPRSTEAQIRSAAAIVRSMSDAQQQLAARIPGLKVDFNDTVRAPEIVSVEGAGVLSSGDSTAREATLRGFLSENSAVYGVTQSQVAGFRKVSDYTNPAGNLSFVEFQQEVNGVPVFQGYVRGVFSRDGQLVRTTGLLAPGVRSASLSSEPDLSAAEGVVAAAHSINIDLPADSFSLLERSPDGRSQLVSRGPFVEDVKTELVYFPRDPGNLVLAYSMVLWQPNVAYYVLVDAKSGALLWRKNITQDQTQSVTYNIYNDDSPTPSSPTVCTAPAPCSVPGGITRTDVTLISENPAFDNLGWIPDGAGDAVTTGNNVDAGLDIASPDGIDPTGRATGTGRVFSFPYIPDGAADPTGANSPTDANYRMGIVTNIFFWTNRYHDLLYNFGFTEPARNFQNDNFGRGGNAVDRVLAQAQDFSGTNNANFSTPPDGTSGRMQMFIFTTTPVNRDGDLDAEVFYHEMTHGTSNRLHANATGLSSQESSGMGEGWSDYYARALLSDASENVDGIYAAGGYVTKNYYYGIRRFPYAVRSNVGPNGKPHNPLTFADIDPTQINLTDGAFPPAFNGAANEVHDIGEVWANTLLEVRARLIHALGFATGNSRAVQTTTDGMKLDPVNPTMIDARNSIMAANCAGFAGANELDIWEGFRLHGMGFRAGYRLGVAGSVVFENFDGPNLTLGNVVATELGGNGNGAFDPGETVALTIPLSNTLCATSATNASATLSPGGGVANYGAIAPAGNGSQTINFTIPTNTACGSAIPLTIAVNSDNLGIINYTFTLPVGQAAPLATFENFDGVTAPNLPAGWTTSHTGNSLGWASVSTGSDTAPNAVTTGDPAHPGTGSLTSPAIPIDTAQAKVSFRNKFNLEDGFDSLLLQIKIDNGPFQDITTAGGSFVSGGYNSKVGWTGLSAGTTAAPDYITSVVNLPPVANGHIVQLRWTVVGDQNTIAPGAAGATIDTIQISTTTLACSTVGASTVTLGGRITDSAANGVPGIQVTLSGGTNATATTNASGNYVFNSLLAGGNYTVTPTSPGFEYTPANLVFNALATNVNNADFTAIPAAGIAGRVTTFNGVQGVDGITVTLSGSQSATTTTANGGFYAFTPLTRHGNYIVTPSGGTNNNFNPLNRTYNDLNSAVKDANFSVVENLSCSPIGAPVTGDISAGDATQVNRLLRDGNPSSCGTNKSFPGESAAASIRFDTYTFTNSSPNPDCVKVTIAANFTAHSVAYLNSYDPANKGTNYLADLGISYGGNNTPASYFVNVPAGATYVIVVNETAVGAGGNYALALCSSSTQPVTPAPAAQPGQVLITEFRQSVGSTTSSNEYVELYNNTEGPISISGYGLAIFNAAFGGDVVLGLPANTVIPRRSHLLIANVAAGGYSLGGYATPDLSHANANLMPDNQGFGLIDASRSVLIDSVGFSNISGNATLPYIRGVGLQPTTGNRPNVEHAWIRRINNLTSYPQNTDNNLADFQVVSVTGQTFTGPVNIQSVLGAPNPENRSSPVERSALSFAGLVDPTAPPSGGENRVRFATCGLPNGPPCPLDPTTSQFGYLSFRRKITNNSGGPVTKLRFKILDLTTLGSPGSGPTQADIRLLTSSDISVTISGVPTTILGTTLDSPPLQALGGGLNSTLSAGTITLATPIPNGASANVQFMLGVQQGGGFRFWVSIDALP